MANTKKTKTAAEKTAEKAVAKVEAAVEEKETKTTAAKTETKTIAAKTTKAAAPKEPTVKVEFQFNSKNTTVDSIVDSIKEAYKAEGNKAAIKTLEVYVQPENDVAYYVINGVEEGKYVNF